MTRNDTIGPANQELVHHEESDVNIRAIFGFAIGLFVVTLVVGAAVWGLFWYFEAREAGSARAYPLATGEVTLPPEPRLQVTPRVDFERMRATEQNRLTTYGWVDRGAGVVHIPIEEAMRLTLERGLPVRQEPAAAPDAAPAAATPPAVQEEPK